jgi:hypothetical protein
LILAEKFKEKKCRSLGIEEWKGKKKKINAFCSTPLTEEAMFMKMRSNWRQRKGKDLVSFCKTIFSSDIVGFLTCQKKTLRTSLYTFES